MIRNLLNGKGRIIKTCFIVLLAIFLILPWLAQAEPLPVEELCKTISCREETHVVLAIDEKSYYEGTFPKSPYVIDKRLVNIIPGETLFLSGVVTDGKLTDLEATKEKPAHKDVIEISLQQKTEKKKHKFMILTINNPYREPLKYSAGILILGKNNMLKTSTCPIKPGLSNYESWPEPILRLLLKEFHFVNKDSKDSMKCE